MVNSRIKHLTAVLLVIAFSLIITGASYGQAGSAQGEKSLYERLGGLQGISLVVSDFMEVFMQDPVIMSNPRVKERKTADIAPYIQYQIVTMVCQATGGPCVYTGLDMKAAHDGLRVSESEWDRMVEIFAATLEKHNVPERETQELFDLVAPTKDDIVVAGDR
jgi:hemoglobin